MAVVDMIVFLIGSSVVVVGIVEFMLRLEV